MSVPSGHDVRVFAALLAIAACGSSEEATPATATPDAGAPAVSPTVPTPAATGTTADAGTAIDAATPTQAKPAPHACITQVSAGHHVFDCDGVRYDVEVSAACAAGGCGVVLDVHGMTMNGDMEDENTGMRARGAAKGYVVVQPTAPPGALGPSWTPKTDDAKVWTVLGDVRKAFAVDPKRVHVTGFSQGAGMTYRFVCEHADEIASAAPAAGTDQCPFDGTQPSRPVSLLFMNGIGDPLANIQAARQQRDRVVAWLGTATQSTVSHDSAHTRTRYQAAKGNTFEFIEHSYFVPPPAPPVPDVIGGHCFPGSNDLTRGPTRPLVFGCNPPSAFVWGEIVMDFFVAHPLP